LPAEERSKFTASVGEWQRKGLGRVEMEASAEENVIMGRSRGLVVVHTNLLNRLKWKGGSLTSSGGGKCLRAKDDTASTTADRVRTG
jgi:hypothetical protein